MILLTPTLSLVFSGPATDRILHISVFQGLFELYPNIENLKCAKFLCSDTPFVFAVIALQRNIKNDHVGSRYKQQFFSAVHNVCKWKRGGGASYFDLPCPDCLWWSRLCTLASGNTPAGTLWPWYTLPCLLCLRHPIHWRTCLYRYRTVFLPCGWPGNSPVGWGCRVPRTYRSQKSLNTHIFIINKNVMHKTTKQGLDSRHCLNIIMRVT